MGEDRGAAELVGAAGVAPEALAVVGVVATDVDVVTDEAAR